LRLLFVLLCLSISNCLICYGQIPERRAYKEETSHRNVLKIGVLSPLFGVINIQYETKHTPNSASQLEFFFFTGVMFGQITEYKGAGVTYNYRYYTKGFFPGGFYVQPFGRIQKFDYVGTQNPTTAGSSGQAYENVNVFGMGLVLGYQKLFAKRFVFDLCAGPVYNIAYIEGDRASGQDIGPPFNGGWLRLGTSIGYAF
jgi:hypothetical protein